MPAAGALVLTLLLNNLNDEKYIDKAKAWEEGVFLTEARAAEVRREGRREGGGKSLYLCAYLFRTDFFSERPASLPLPPSPPPLRPASPSTSMTLHYLSERSIEDSLSAGTTSSSIPPSLYPSLLP